MIDLNTMRFLIVDDIESMCKSIRAMLKILQYGEKFYLARNGLEAWEILKNKPVDLVIADWNMPVMGGIELLSRTRKNKKLRDIPFVVITIEAKKEIVAEAAESDIDAYILKPLTVKSLGDKIAGVLEKINNPPPMLFHLKKARSFEESGDIDAAIGEANLAMKAEPLSSKPLRQLGYFFYKKNDLEKAENYFLRAIKMNHLDVFAFHYLAKLHLQRNNINEAAKFFDKAMRISPRHVSRGINFGKVLVQKNNITRAIGIFEKSISITDDPLSLREEIADFCLEKGIYGYALELMEIIVKHVPTRYDILFKMGIANELMGKHKKALKYLMEAKKNDNDTIETNLHIATNYIAIGHTIKADQILKSVLALDPTNKKAKDLLRQCI